MKILITGASGFLGSKLFEMYSQEHEVLGTYNTKPVEGLQQLDITDAEKTQELISYFRPDVVIHTVAMSDPDVCEQNPELADQVNHLGTKNVVDACRDTGARLDYISTVYVYDGVKGNYTEEDETIPVNKYGETKLAAEREVRSLPSYGIYRFDKVYGYNGVGRPNDALTKIDAGKPFEVNFDQVRQPIFAEDIGRSIMIAQETHQNGVFNLAGPDRVSKFDLTVELAKLTGREGLVIPIPEKEQIARRPKDTTVMTGKIEGLGMKFTPLSEALVQINTELHPNTIEGVSHGIEK